MDIALRPLFFEFTRLIGEAKAMGPNPRNSWSVARWTRVCTTLKTSLDGASIRERLVADNPALWLPISSN